LTGRAAGLFNFFLILIFSFPSQSAGEIGKSFISIERVNDGDTVTARVNGRQEKIRLLGIDAPEMGQSPWGEIARRYLSSLVSSSSASVRIEYDTERRDKYGRLLAYLWTKNGRMANREMLTEGCAFLFIIPPNSKYAGQMIDDEREARKKQAGVWQKNGLRQLPSEYRRAHPRQDRMRLRMGIR
jgi:micrococcal nuclease